MVLAEPKARWVLGETMGMFDRLRDRLKEVEQEAEDAAVSMEDLRKSDDELLAELDAELGELDEEQDTAPGGAVDDDEPDASEQQADAGTEAPEAAPEPKAESAPAAQETPASEHSKPSPSAGQTSAPEAKAPTKKAKGRFAIDPERVEDLLWDLELVLLESDVAVDVAHALRDEMEQRLPKIRVDQKSEVPDAIEAALRDAIVQMLEGSRFDFDEWVLTNSGDKPLVVMFVGVNGTGKTTTIARVAHRMKELGFGVALAAGDTFRAGAIEQLQKHGDNLGVRVIKHTAGSDPAAVAYDAIEHAKARKKSLVLVDTAGRMQTNSNLMDEVKKIDRVANPDLTIFVGDSLAGNDAIDQAQKFDEAVGLDACVLTKVDTDAKGGAALSIARAVGKPVAYLGVGQDYDDLIPFDPNWLVQRIFGD